MTYDPKAGRPLSPRDLTHATPTIPGYVYDAVNACIASASHFGSKYGGIRFTGAFLASEIHKRAAHRIDAELMARYLGAVTDYKQHGWKVTIEVVAGHVVSFLFEPAENDS